MAEKFQFTALEDFRKSLKEVDILCETAEAFHSDQAKYSTFNKAALMLIAGKFETFVESLVEEYIFRLNELKLPCHTIPKVVRLHHSFKALAKLETLRPKHKHPEALLLFDEIGRLWGTQEKFTSLHVDSTFSYGKHGEDELVGLFERIGIVDVFQAVTLVEQVETVSADAPLPTVVDFRGIFNSVTHLRNNILHEDASPNVTSALVRKHRGYFESFAQRLDAHLAEMLPPD